MPEAVRHQALIDWMRLEMERRDWTISDLARRMDVQPSLVSRWLRNQPPNWETAREIAEAFGTSHVHVLRMAGMLDEEGGSPEADRICGLARRIEWTPERYWIVVELMERLRKGVPSLPSSSSGDAGSR